MVGSSTRLPSMPSPRSLPPDGVPDTPRIVDSPGASVRPEIHNQLTNFKDISSAHNYFSVKPNGAESLLPNISTSPQGFEVGLSKTLSAAPLTPTGLEAMSMPGAPLPGAEPISPLINMIMKMPGHIGLASSFFECLANFFMPGGAGGDMMTMSFLDPSLMDGGSEMLSSALDGAGEHMSADLSLLDGDAPIFETMSESQLTADGIAHPFSSDLGLIHEGNPSLMDSFNNSPRLEIGGGASPGKALFEQAQPLNFRGNPDLLAMDPGGGFNSTIGPAGSTTITPQAPTNYVQQQPMPQGTNASADYLRDTLKNAPHEGQGTQWPSAENGAGADATGTTTDATTDATTPYTVQSGDNLWDLASKHLGDGSRWGEIYKLNEGVIGSNPRLIMPGTELQLPGDATISMDPYTVQPGDNLWNISKDHLGGGQNWHELYKENAQTIGANPDLIHPGQHLHMPGSPDASAAGGEHLAQSHAQHANTAGGANHQAHGSNHSHTAQHSEQHRGGDHSHKTLAQAPKHSSPAAPGSAQAPVELKAQAQSLPDLNAQPEMGKLDSSTIIPNQ